MASEIDLLKQGVAKKLNEVMNPPKDQIKKPHNRLWIALLAFNLIFLPLDLATGATVGYVTRWYYGLFVFGAGFGTMIIHEALFSNPFAKTWQKIISVVGFLTSIAVTAIIGVAAIVINVLFTGYNQELYGAAMAGTAFLVLFFHGILIAAYYFTDAGILAKQKATAVMADHEQTLTNFTFSEQMVDAINSLEKRLVARIDKGDGARMGAALESVTGQTWISTPQQQMKSYNSNTDGVTLPTQAGSQNQQPPRQS